jgi:hypothetical protein
MQQSSSTTILPPLVALVAVDVDAVIGAVVEVILELITA